MRRVIRRAPSVCGGFAIAVGAIVLAGWWAGLPRLTSFVPGLPATAASTALMAILLGTSVILSARNAPSSASRCAAIARKACACVVATTAAVTLIGYALGLDLRIDRILLSTGETLLGRDPDRPPPYSAAAFLFAAAALLLSPSGSARRRRAADLLVLASGLLPLMAGLGHLFGVAAAQGPSSLLPYAGMGIPGALVLLALSSGIAASRIEEGLLSILMKEDSGGTAARHFAAWILAFAPVVCAIAIGARIGLYAAPLASALVVLSGAVVGSAFVLGVSRHLSRLDAEQREAGERLELALRGGDLAAWDWDIESGEVIFSPRWAEMRGFHPGELEPHVDTWFSGIHPEDLPRVQEVLGDYLQGRTDEYETEHRVRTRSGQWIWILDRGKVFARDDRGRPIRMVGTELDITPRKRLEEEKAFLAEMGSLLASTLEIEVTLTSLGRLVTRELADVCVVYAVEEGHAFRRSEIVTKDPSRAWIRDVLVQHALDRRETPSIWSELEAHRSILLERVPPEMITAHAQDEAHARALRAMNISSSITVPLVARGRLVGAMALISSDPSRAYAPADVRFAEQIAQRAAVAIENARLYDEAQRAIQTRDDVLGVVAHDLRNPLNAILLHAELLRESGAAPARLSRAPAEAIERSARRMSHLIEDLLDVTRMEAGHLPVEQVRVAAGALVRETVEAQRPLTAAAALELRVDAARDLPDVWADRDRLQQVFENLIGNGLKFTGPGGTITLGAAPREGEVLFWVADTGSGIAGEDLPHVFDRFWQAGRPGRQGAGLGLPIVKGIVEAHGGRIWAESTPGCGTTFSFTIPSTPRVEEQRAAPAPRSP